MDLPSAPIHPCQRRHRQRGEECLPGVQLPEPEEKYRRERPGKSGDRLQAAVLRKQGRALERIAVSWGGGQYHPPAAVQDGARGPDGRHDGKSPGRPRLLNPGREKVPDPDTGRQVARRGGLTVLFIATTPRLLHPPSVTPDPTLR